MIAIDDLQFCCNRYRLRACDLVNRAYYEHVIDKASTGRLGHSVQCCADLIWELVMAREWLLVLSDSRISKDDVCAVIEHLCVEWRCNYHAVLLFYFFAFFCFSFVFILILYFVYDVNNNNNSKSYMGFSKKAIIGSLKFKMADGRHITNR